MRAEVMATDFGQIWGRFAFATIVIGVLAVPTLSQSLRQEVDCRGVLIGTAVRPAQFSELPYASTLAREFNLIQPEDVMKWSTIQPDRPSFDFAAGDAVVDFAAAHQMKVRGHTLVWGRHNPL